MRDERSKRHDSGAQKEFNDLEDFGNKATSTAFGPRPIIRHYEANNERNSVKLNDQEDSEQQQNDSSSKDQPLSQLQQNEITCEDVDRTVDYQGWLQIKKRKWKDIMERRKKRR